MVPYANLCDLTASASRERGVRIGISAALYADPRSRNSSRYSDISGGLLWSSDVSVSRPAAGRRQGWWWTHASVAMAASVCREGEVHANCPTAVANPTADRQSPGAGVSVGHE